MFLIGGNLMANSSHTSGYQSKSQRAPQDTHTSAVNVETPGWVTFAAAMLFLHGIFQFAWAIVEFYYAPWIASTAYGTFGGHLWLWAILDLALGLVAVYAGYSILVGGRFGQIFGLCVAGIGATRWFFYLPAAPWLATVMIALDVLIIYALVKYDPYFGAEHTRW
jgi:hypothetical protein